MSDVEFKMLTGAVMTKVAEKDKNMTEEFARFWKSEFATHKYQFDRQERDIATLNALTKADLQAYFEQIFFKEGR